MFPVILRFPESWPLLGGVAIYSYGVLVASAFLVGLLWALHEAKLAGVDKTKVADLVFYSIVAAIVGSRLLYVIIEHERFLADPLAIFKIWEGGLVFYGGLLACMAVATVYAHKQGWTLRKAGDLLMPSVALGHAVGRLGCLMAGCCYGRPAGHEAWWTLVFPATELGLAPAGIPLIPSQLMESLAELCLFGVLVLIRRRKKFEGQVFLSYLILYAVVRSILEMFRGDKVRGFLIPDLLSTSQFISLLVILFCIVYYRNLRKKEVSL